MEFRKYMHVERLGSCEVDGIDVGKCYIFPKIDGTNASVWTNDDGSMGVGSRRRTLSLDADNAGFCLYAINSDPLRELLLANPNWYIYGEWLVPHTLKTYRNTAWRKFYIFDIWNTFSEEYMPYETYKEVAESYGISVIPPLSIVEKPTMETFWQLINENQYLIEDDKGSGEGIVIKQYGYKNKFGRTCWAKVVRNEFKDMHSSNQPNERRAADQIEDAIASKYVTQAVVDKAFASIEDFSSRKISQLLQTVFYDVVREDIWNIVKEHKNPKIDFKRLQSFVYGKVKELKPELF